MSLHKKERDSAGSSFNQVMRARFSQINWPMHFKNANHDSQSELEGEGDSSVDKVW